MIALHYHAQTKHHFHRFARSLGYLDWATQPDPFRRYAGAPVHALSQEPLAVDVPYAALFDGSAAALPIDEHAIGEFLRCAMGLSAWKQYGVSRWALRVNPSSGNLHPTEAYLVHRGRVCHYAPREHALEERCVFDATAWNRRSVFLVALTTIHWREAWKYGERSFRYCQHDTGHAIAALRLSAARLGWTLRLLPRWADTQIAALLGVGRDADYPDAEREDVECLAIVAAGDAPGASDPEPAALVAAANGASWRGIANRLSASRVDWPIIDEVAAATRYPGIRDRGSAIGDPADRGSGIRGDRGSEESARAVILRRRSALAFDGTSGLRRDVFSSMLRRLRPPGPPWDAIDWPPHVHLALFVHRVEDMTPGLYAYLREETVLDEWRSAMRQEFVWERVDDLFLLKPFDCRRLANRVSCDQEIAEDGFFSLAMVARLESSLRERGEWFYRRLFWECGMIGQVLYLAAETVGARATGIGCFYDDPVHETLGLVGHEWQSLYHFSMGVPVDDPRLTSEPGYSWEKTI